MSESQPVQTGVPQCYRHPGRETGIRCQRCDRPICPDCMRPAAVGFQCPSCVKEGSRSVRSARLPYGGLRVANPTLVTTFLIGVNVVVWLAITADGGGTSRLAYELGLIPNFGVRPDVDPVAGLQGVQVAHGVGTGAWWQVVTSMFTHIAFLHLAVNMLALWFVGPPLEQVLGRLRFLALYLVSGLCGSAAVMLFAPQNQTTVGASGAIFGLLGALAVLTFKVGGDWRNVLTWIGLNLVLTFTLSNISWQGHLGGLAGGTLVGLGLVYAPRSRRTAVQVAVTGGILLVAAALIVVRAASLPDTFGISTPP